MDDTPRRRGRGGDVPTVDESTSQPVETATEEASRVRRERQEEPKRKLTISLKASKIRLLNALASELDMETCELVEALITPALKGCSRPTVTPALRSILATESRSAA